MTQDKKRVGPLDLLRVNTEMFKGTIPGIVSDKAKDIADSVQEPTDLFKSLVAELATMNKNLVKLDSSLNILSERL